jgi:hypothetical protein
MENGLLLGLGATRFFPFLQYATGVMPKSVAWAGAATGILIMLSEFLPAELKPSLAAVSLCLIGVLCFAGAGHLYLSRAAGPVPIRLFAQCDPVGRPVVPPDGRMFMLQLNVIPSEQAGGGIGFGGGVPGASIDFGIQTIYRCQFTNYSNDPLFKASVALHLTFSEAIKDQNSTSFRSGKITIDREWLFEIPKIDTGRDAPFVFFILNASPQFVSVTLPSEVVLSAGSDGQSRSVDFIQPTNTRMIFPPNTQISKK